MRKEDAVIGARVIAIIAVDGNEHTLNETGTIIWNRPFARYDLCVEFDEEVLLGHSGQHREFSGKEGHCWWGKFEDFELLSDDSVEIKLSFDDLLGG